MLNEAEYRSVLAALRSATRLPAIETLAAVSARTWFAKRDPVFVREDDPVPEPTDIAPSELGRLWHAGAIAGFSLQVEDRSESRQTRCVFRCASGEIQEASCSERAEDFRNCWDAVKSRCKIENVEFIKSNRGSLMDARVKV